MKTRIAFIALVLAFASHATTYAQLFSKKKYTGMVILTNQDTVSGNIVFKDKAPFYKKITVQDSVTKEESYFDLTNASSFVMDGDVFYNKEKKEGDRTFMLRLATGKVSLYRYKEMGSDGNEQVLFYLEKKGMNSLAVQISKPWEIDASVSKFFDDYSRLSQKIINKEYKTYDLITIVEEYNEWAKISNEY